jgi:hypothetical protein
MTPRRVARLAIHFALLATLGVMTSLVVACVGGVIGTTNLRVSPGKMVSAVRPDGRSVLFVRQARLSPFIREYLLNSAYSAHIERDAVVVREFFRETRVPRDDRAGRPLHPLSTAADQRTEYHVGWPAPCLWGATESFSGGTDLIRLLPVVNIVRVWPWTSTARVNDILPFASLKFKTPRSMATGILPLGSAVNTAIFAALWWALLFLPGAFRRHLRLRRNHCPCCNYNLFGLPAGSSCPECGASSFCT